MQYLHTKNLQKLNDIKYTNLSVGGPQVNLLVSEPVFASSVLPWHNMYFTQLKKDFASFLTDDVTIIPGKAHVYVMGIEMKDLWKIRAPVCSSQGVDLTHFDELIMVRTLAL